MLAVRHVNDIERRAFDELDVLAVHIDVELRDIRRDADNPRHRAEVERFFDHLPGINRDAELAAVVALLRELHSVLAGRDVADYDPAVG